MPSFDVVSEPNLAEIDNAINQATKEITTRFDFKGTGSEIAWDSSVLTLVSNGEEKLKTLKSIVHEKLIKRGVSLNFFEFGEPEAATGQKLRQKATLQKGISKEKAKELNKLIKELNLKVQSQIQGEQLRVTGKKRDDLQECMGALKKAELGISLSFTNFRD